MIKPNFLIIGSPKCGTTSLYHYLGQHPNIEFSKVKEPKYFSFKDLNLNFNKKSTKIALEQLKNSTIKDIDSYLELFSGLNSQYIGEASPNYFHFEPAAKNIFEFNPDMKMIVILRNPIDRLYSDWKHNVRMGYEPEYSFKKSLSLIEKRKANNYPPYFNYLEKGDYSKHLKRYYSLFSKKQIKVILYDDFKLNPNNVCNNVISFLGVKNKFKFETSKIYIKSSVIKKNNMLTKLLPYIQRLSYRIYGFFKNRNTISEVMSKSNREIALNYYKKDIQELETLINRDLSSWYKK